jgi:Asp-tRNA(Asn)/Glu-tRNA(Gln) amidotransferase A subunit family amidase
MAGLTELLNNIGSWGVNWRERAITAEAAAEAQKTRAEAAEAHAQALIDQDAEEDLEQAAAVRAEATAEAQAKWDELQALDTPPTVPEDNIDPDTGEPIVPVDEDEDDELF